MALKSPVGKIYNLLAACAPTDERVARRLAFEDIIESREYRELAECECFQAIFAEKYSPEVLSRIDSGWFPAIKSAAEIIPTAMERLFNAIKFGNGWELGKDDIPDFYSRESVSGFLGKLKFDEIYCNDTNITQESCMEIFTAVKSPLEDRNGKFYCIKRTIEEDFR